MNAMCRSGLCVLLFVGCNEKNQQGTFDANATQVEKATDARNLDPTPEEADLSLTSLLRRQADVFASNSAGLFRAELASKRWRRLTLPEQMPICGTFAQVPQNSPLILYWVAKS